MTTDTFDTSIVDDSCLSDIFTMQAQTLHDFEFGLEAPDIGSLLELFEENEKRKFDYQQQTSSKLAQKSPKKESPKKESPKKGVSIVYNCSKVIVNKKKSNQEIINPKVKQNILSENTNKRKGVSLLVKPKKASSIIKSINQNVENSNSLQQDHSYCLSTTVSVNHKNDSILQVTTCKSILQDFDIPIDLFEDHSNKFSDHIDLADLKCSDDIFDMFDCNIETEIIISDDLFQIDNEDQNEVKETNQKTEVTLNNEEINKCVNDSIKNECFNNKQTSNSESKSKITTMNIDLPRSYQRTRRISTRSSVASSSQSSTSERSSSCSSCSSCSYSASSGESDNSYYSIKNGRSKKRLKREKNRSWGKEKNSKFDIYSENNYCKNQISKNFKKSFVKEHDNDIEERKIIYVGKIPDGTTKSDLRHRFGKFGPIKEVSVHFRDFGDNYAFVTYFRRSDAYEAIEHGNDDKKCPKFDLSFGGRRKFCKSEYEDLDYVEENCNSTPLDFDSLLKKTKSKLIH